jgi:hypothetical protein
MTDGEGKDETAPRVWDRLGQQTQRIRTPGIARGVISDTDGMAAILAWLHQTAYSDVMKGLRRRATARLSRTDAIQSGPPKGLGPITSFGRALGRDLARLPSGVFR